MEPIADPAEVFARHERIAFQFSGGRDSLAALYLLRPYWKRMRVYHLNHGDQFPETAAVVDQVRRDVPMTVIHSDSVESRIRHGLPSDLLPADNTGMGRALTGRTVAMQGRFDCCARVVMAPMHERMLRDGITCIVRGVRAADFAGSHEFLSGHVAEGIELYYPIERWKTADVMRYLLACNLPIARFYAEGLDESPECMGCTAWIGKGHLRYLRSFYPARHQQVQRNITLIRAEVDRQYAEMEKES